MNSLDDGDEERNETFEDAYKEPIYTSLPIVAVKETQLEEHAAMGEDLEKAMVLYQPLALVMQEEQEQADAHEAEVEAFTGLEDPIETHENPR